MLSLHHPVLSTLNVVRIATHDSDINYFDNLNNHVASAVANGNQTDVYDLRTTPRKRLGYSIEIGPGHFRHLDVNGLSMGSSKAALDRNGEIKSVRLYDKNKKRFGKFRRRMQMPFIRHRDHEFRFVPYNPKKIVLQWAAGSTAVTLVGVGGVFVATSSIVNRQKGIVYRCPSTSCPMENRDDPVLPGTRYRVLDQGVDGFTHIRTTTGKGRTVVGYSNELK